MTEQECLAKMKAPGDRKPGKWREGVCQILVTHSCDKSCFNCTQGSHLQHVKWEMTPEQFRLAVRSLKGYFGVIGLFGGNPALSPYFNDYCDILRELVPFEQCGIWCNNPITLQKAQLMSRTFNPGVSNLNVHMDARAHALFKEGWPGSMPFGLYEDSRHSPTWGSMKQLGIPEAERWDLISRCTINQHWSPMIGVFRGELRAWFCEIAGAHSIHHQHDPDYPDTGIKIMSGYGGDGLSDFSMGDGKGVRTQWWRMGMHYFRDQVRSHCHDCLVPLNGYGELAVSNKAGKEQITEPHVSVFKPKSKGRAVELVMRREQLEEGRIGRLIDYVKNSKK